MEREDLVARRDDMAKGDASLEELLALMQDVGLELADNRSIEAMARIDEPRPRRSNRSKLSR